MIQDLGSAFRKEFGRVGIACGGKHTAELWNKQGFTLNYFNKSKYK
jgi:hypothetical protein